MGCCRNPAQTPQKALSMRNGPRAELISSPGGEGHRHLLHTHTPCWLTCIQMGKGRQHSRCVTQLCAFLEPIISTHVKKDNVLNHQVTGVLPAPFRVSLLGTDVPTPLASTPFHVVPETVKCWRVTSVEPRARCSGSLEGTVSCSNGQGCRGTGC